MGGWLLLGAGVEKRCTSFQLGCARCCSCVHACTACAKKACIIEPFESVNIEY